MGLNHLRTWTVFHICLFITFLVSSIIINVVQAVLYFSIGIVSKTLYRAINGCLVWQIHAQVIFVGSWWSRSYYRLHCQKDVINGVEGQKAILFLNHTNELDWLFSWVFCNSFGVLGNGKAVVKTALKYIPTFGWAWAYSDFIFLKRNWKKDKEIINQGIDTLQSYPSSMWLLFFPEGTRISPNKLEESQIFAKERRLPVLKHHLIPRTKGFVQMLNRLDTNKISYVYDATLGIHPSDGGEATLTNILLGKKTVGDIYLRRYKTSDIPKDEEGAQNWLMNLYREKDELLGYYKETRGTKFSENDVPVITVPKTLGVLVNTVLLNLSICTPILYKLCLMLLSGNNFEMCVVISIVLALYVIMKKFIDLTKISKASKYGEKKQE